MAAIQLANDMGETTVVRAGQELRIPLTEDWPGASAFWVVHEVRPGDTLVGLAAHYDLELAAIRMANGLGDGDLLVVGQLLILPLDAPAQEAPTETATPEPTATLEPTALLTGTATLTVTSTMTITARPPDADATATSTSVLPSDTTVAAGPEGWPEEVYRLINAERATAGLAPYVYNETLAQAARLHGQDCLQRGSCNHTGSDGSNVTQRVTRAGYAASGAAECIVYSRTPQEAVAWWMDEVPPDDWHRRTLLSTWVTEIGVGVVPIGNGYYYFIADFGRPAQ
jgi:uncharacterized protein YkwD